MSDSEVYSQIISKLLMMVNKLGGNLNMSFSIDIYDAIKEKIYELVKIQPTNITDIISTYFEKAQLQLLWDDGIFILDPRIIGKISYKSKYRVIVIYLYIKPIEHGLPSNPYYKITIEGYKGSKIDEIYEFIQKNVEEEHYIP